MSEIQIANNMSQKLNMGTHVRKRRNKFSRFFVALIKKLRLNRKRDRECSNESELALISIKSNSLPIVPIEEANLIKEKNKQDSLLKFSYLEFLSDLTNLNSVISVNDDALEDYRRSISWSSRRVENHSIEK